MGRFWREILRVRWMLIVAVGVLVARTYGWLQDTSAAAVVLYKPSLAAIGFIAAHVGYQQAFPYIDQRELLVRARDEQSTNDRLTYAVLFTGVCLLRG
jgi:hypothetical protein